MILLGICRVVPSGETAEVIADGEQVVFHRLGLRFHSAALPLHLHFFGGGQVRIDDELADVEIVQGEFNKPTSANTLRFEFGLVHALVPSTLQPLHIQNQYLRSLVYR